MAPLEQPYTRTFKGFPWLRATVSKNCNMELKKTLKKAAGILDRLSPYPMLYSFVMSEEEKAIFDIKIRTSRNYLEFGLGGTTLRALKKSTAKVFVVESSSDWISKIRQYALVRYFEGKRLFITHVDIGPTIEWGFPESDHLQDRFPDYSSNIFLKIDGRMIDLALIDGRFRVACALKVVLECHLNNHIEILIHDFWNREHYHVLLEYLDVVARVDTLGVFSIKRDVDLKSALRDYEAYRYNPA